MSYRVGLVGSARKSDFGLRSSDAKSDIATLALNSRLRRVGTFVRSDSESEERSVDRFDLRMSSQGSVSDRGESSVKSIVLRSVLSQNSRTEPQLGTLTSKRSTNHSIYLIFTYNQFACFL